MDDKAERKRNRIIALLLFLVALATYLKTVSPSVPFWDCGEFIATSHIMGVPHPPGAPLFILVGRFFILFLPFIQEVALRVNFISVLFCALAVLFFYLCVIRIISRWIKPLDSTEKRIILYTGAIVGSLFMTFSATFWFNATEAEVYGIAMFFNCFICWLMLIWAERYRERDSDRFLFLIIYLLFLGITNHMTVFLIAPPVFLYVFVTDKEKLYDWKFWTIGILLSTILFSIVVFIVLSAIALVGTLAVMLLSPQQTNYNWKYLGLAFLVAIVGYSTYIYIPIRAKLAPSINENNPDNWDRYKMFMERKQYGQESMVTRMFKRRGSWANQFGDHQRMGFWYFFKDQYMRKELWFIPVLLGLFGMMYHWKRDRKTAAFTLSLFLTFSLLLLIYINFSDGTKGDHLEVRDRDYFYTQAYAFYPLWLGIGAVGILEWLRSRWKAKKPTLYGGAALFIALSFVPFFQNYHVHDRTGNYVAHDYAYNILISCDPDAILFTNGDNDTFPLWFLQEVKNIRKDVRVVNLSLLNTPWYIKQLRDYEPTVPINLTDTYIDEKLAVTDPSRLFQEPTKKVTVAGLTWDLKPSREVTYQGTKYGYLTVQDMMVMRIIERVNWKQPVYFAVTVSPENKINLDKYLRMEGLVLRLVQEEGMQQLDPERSSHNLWDLYLYRGVNDEKVYKDDQTMKLLSNYQASYVYLAQILMQEGRNEEAVQQLERLNELVPVDDWRTSMFTAQLYSNMRKWDRAAEYTKKALELNPGFTQGKLNLPMLLERAGKVEEAVQIFKDLIEENPNLGQAYTGLADLYAKQQEYQQAVDVLRGWLARNPNDNKAKQTLEQYERALTEPAPASTDTTP
jgi:Flp pilus assembly protein TadD